MGWERAGRSASFVAPNYVAGPSERDWHARFGGTGVTVQPMSLRQIFVALARAQKSNVNGAAA